MYTAAARQDLCPRICKHCEQDSAANRTVRPMGTGKVDDTGAAIVVLVGLEAEHRFSYQQWCISVSCQMSLDYTVHTTGVGWVVTVGPGIQDGTINCPVHAHQARICIMVGKDPYQHFESLGGAIVAFDDFGSSLPFVTHRLRELHVEATSQCFDILQRSTSYATA